MEKEIHVRTVKRSRVKEDYSIHPKIVVIDEEVDLPERKLTGITYTEKDGFLVKTKIALYYNKLQRQLSDVEDELKEKLNLVISKILTHYKPSAEIIDVKGHTIDIKILEDETDTSKRKVEHKE